MASTMEPTGPHQSLMARRSAASSLPSFELPPPPSISQKFLQYQNVPTTQSTPAMVSVGNLLTPPSNIPGDSLSPISSTISNNGNGGQHVQPYTPTGSFWPPSSSNNTQFSIASGTTPQPQPWNNQQASVNPLFPPRGMFSPSLSSQFRNSSNSPSSTNELPPPPPFDMNQMNQLPPFPGTMSMSASSPLPSVSAQQHQHQQAQLAAFMNGQISGPAPATQGSPVNPPDAFARPPPTPSYHNGTQPSSTPQNNQFPPFQNPSPVQQSPMSASNPQGARVSPLSPQNPSLQQAAQQQGNACVRNYTPYNLPAMNGPIMTNVHNPGGPMTILGMPSHGMPGNIVPGFNSGSSAQMQQMYGGHQQAQHNERPFKCDQCPQSFNRNHDLKRHKRIHLAVKPFPCGHCEKSFSRKDALKVSGLAFGLMETPTNN